MILGFISNSYDRSAGLEETISGVPNTGVGIIPKGGDGMKVKVTSSKASLTEGNLFTYLPQWFTVLSFVLMRGNW